MTIEVTIEIPKGQRNKYEVDHETGKVYLDRYLFTMSYPADCSYIEDTLGEDGDRWTPGRAAGAGVPGVIVKARPVGVFKMTDGPATTSCSASSTTRFEDFRTSATSPSSPWTNRALLRALQGPRARQEVKGSGWGNKEEADASSGGHRPPQVGAGGGSGPESAARLPLLFDDPPHAPRVRRVFAFPRGGTRGEIRNPPE